MIFREEFMMKKYSVIALLLTIFLLICMPIASFAENPNDSEEIPSVEELAEFIKKTWNQGRWVFRDCLEDLFRLKESEPDYPAVKWAEEEGLLTETPLYKSTTELYGINRHTGELIPYDPTVIEFEDRWACAFPETVTLSDLEEICCRYFTADYRGIFACPEKYPHNEKYCFFRKILSDKNGRLYSVPSDWSDTSRTEIESYEKLYKSAKITNQTADTIEVTLYAPDPAFFWTVNFRKTADGWRISGGDFFGDPMLHVPPETDDRTPALLTASLLSLAALTAMAVGFSRKRKKEF